MRYLIVGITVAGTIFVANSLDRLPSAVHSSIAAERSALAAAQVQIKNEREQVAALTQSDSALFGSLAFGTQWPGRFDSASAILASASRDMGELGRIEKHNRHSDVSQAQALLQAEKNLRTRALSDADGVVKEASRWEDAKTHLPQTIQGMERDYKAIHAFDLAPLTAVVQHAETDWPAKKADLESRLHEQRAIVTRTDLLWQSTAADRRKASAAGIAGVNTGALLAAADTLSASAANQPKQAEELRALTGQLYNSWDKVLVDMQARGEGTAREYDQKFRTVTTHQAAATATAAETKSDEQWVVVSKPAYDAMRNDLGMAVEHKSAGLYDSEAEHTAQPAGMAYVAPPSQGSNQYGHWEHHDGRDFWVFYGQYALLRDLLFNHGYRQYDRYDWDGYRSSQSRGQTYYGHDAETGTPKYGSGGSATKNGYSGSKYAQTGGFKDSQYASKPGGFRDSPYASRSEAPKSFGHEAAPRPAPPRGFRPAPAPSRPPMRSSPGRSFGRRK